MNLKKLRNSKGLTGTDVALSAGIILLTMGIVIAIYININSNSKEMIRYSAATRIATQLIETIQADTYDEVVYRCKNDLNSSSSSSASKIFDVNVPKGYSATVKATSPSNATLDIIRDIEVTVTYSDDERSITLYTVKEKEILEQTNEPDLSLIDDYSDSSYYAVKYVDGEYVITATSDPDWYNYDEGYYALLLKSSGYSYGDPVDSITTAGTLYVWIPKFGGTTSADLAYCYGTSKYKISFGTYLFSSDVSGYTVTGSYANDTWTTTAVTSTIDSSFDGVTGIWVTYSEIDNATNSVYETFNDCNPQENL